MRFKHFRYFLLSLSFFSTSLFAQLQYETSFIKNAGNVGGNTEFKRFLKQELIYPDSSLEAGIGGKITWKFTINKKGELSNFRLLQTVNEELANEALRLIKRMQWEPVFKSGEKRDSQMEFSIVFNAKKHPKICKKRGYTEIPFPYTPVDTSLTIHKKVDTAPKFKLKDYDLPGFLRDNLKYPKQAAVQNIKGTVIIGFVVEPSGMVTNIGVEQYVGGGCSEEAVRLVGLTKWTPGIKDNKAVRTKMKLPVGFNFEINARDGMNREQRTY